MKIKLKNGTEVDLHDEDIKMIHDMYSKGNFDAEKLEHYFKEMLSKSETNMCMISEQENSSEKEIKQSLTKVIKYGTEEEVADFIIEAMEFMISHMIIESME